MSFSKKTWKDRVSEYPTRRILTKTDNTSETVTVIRSEGTISQEGDTFSAENMNDLEDRIGSEFDEVSDDFEEVNTELSTKVTGFTEGSYSAVTGLAYNSTTKKLGLKVGADTVINFSSTPQNATEIYNDTGRNGYSYTYTVQSEGIYLAEALGQNYPSPSVAITTASGSVLYSKKAQTDPSSAYEPTFSHLAVANLKVGDKIIVSGGYYGGGRIVKLS